MLQQEVQLKVLIAKLESKYQHYFYSSVCMASQQHGNKKHIAVQQLAVLLKPRKNNYEMMPVSVS